MRNLTRLAFAFAAAACGSEEDRCDPFLEAMDCVRGQTPVGVRRYGELQDEAPTVSSSSQIGPSAGDANGPGPSAGDANGPGPSPGPIESSGPTAGSAQGAGPSAGSANPADVLFVSEGVALTCASYCETIYTACGAEFSDDVPISVAQLIDACAFGCECLRAAAPDCVDAIFRIAGPCLGRGSCDAIEACFQNIEETVPEPAACMASSYATKECLYSTEDY